MREVDPMGGPTCEELREATSGCEVLLLVAADGEAALLVPALERTRSLEVLTKKLVVGDLVPLDRPASPSPAPVAARAAAVRGGGRRVVVAVSGLDKVNAAMVLTCLLQAMDPAPRLVLQTGIAGAFVGAGGFAGASVGDIVVATQEAYSDTGSSSPMGWLSARELGWPIAWIGGGDPADREREVRQGRQKEPEGRESGGVFPLEGRLVEAALETLAAAAGRERAAWPDRGPEEVPRMVAGPFLTASRVTGLASEARELAERWGAVAESMEGAAAAHVCALFGIPFLEVRGVSNLVVDRDRASWEVPRAVAAASWAVRVILDALDRLPLPGTAVAKPGGA